MHVQTYTLNSENTSFPGKEEPANGSRTLVTIFGASQYLDNPHLISQIVEAYPQAAIIGCSTAGEIEGTKIQDDSVVVGVSSFAHTSMSIASASISDPASSLPAGETLARQLKDPSLRGVFVLSDGLFVNGSELVRGLNSVLPSSVVVTGGLAGDGTRFQRTWIIKDGLPHTGFVTAVGLYGDHIRIGHGSKGGWDIFGPERKVTRAEGNVLFELDGEPALQLYKEYLGERADGLPATGLFFPLALRMNPSDEKYLVRTILAVDETQQSMTFAGDIPQGSMAQLMRANLDRLVTGASEAATLSGTHSDPGIPTFSIAISCVGRRLVLGERSEEEIEAALEVLPPNTRQIGFYSYGELSPFASGSCDLHNQTMTLTTFQEV
jgi:hypothetical protein